MVLRSITRDSQRNTIGTLRTIRNIINYVLLEEIRSRSHASVPSIRQRMETSGGFPAKKEGHYCFLGTSAKGRGSEGSSSTYTHIKQSTATLYLADVGFSSNIKSVLGVDVGLFHNESRQRRLKNPKRTKTAHL